MADENTVSVAAGSTTVLGHLTQFVGFAGDTFNCGGMSIPVAAVVSTSELTLAYGWPGADVVDSAAWVLMPTSAEWSSTVSLHKAIVEANAWRNGKFPFPFNNGGPISKRSLFDGEPMGFTFLELTGNQDDPFRLYGKMSDDSGDWSAGQTLRGDAAISTGEAIAAAALAQAWATQTAGEVEPGEGYSAKYHALATAADRVATGQDRAATAADRVATSQDKAATAADRVATGEDKAATASDRGLAQQWATKTDGEVVAGQGRGSKYYSEQAAATLAKSVRVDADQVFTGAEKTKGQTNLGATATGRALFGATDALAARTAIGATATGSALITATDAPAARTAIGAQAAIGYTPVNKAGDTMTGNLVLNNLILGNSTIGYMLIRDGAGGARGQFGVAIGSGYGDSVGLSCDTSTGELSFATNNVRRMAILANGNVNIGGTLSKGGGTFLVDHPLDPLNRNLRHGFVEAPRYDLIYRGVVRLVDGEATVDIDAASNMTSGTFAALTTNARVACLQNQDGFARCKPGAISGGSFEIICEDLACNDEIAWVVIAERNDPFVKSAMDQNCDSDGRFVPEFDKPVARPPETA